MCSWLLIDPSEHHYTIQTLKPQDSFDEFNNFFLDLRKVQEIIRKHHQTFLQLFGMTYCNAILPNGKFIIMYITYAKVFGGTPNIFMFWLFPENGSISERTVNRALKVHTTLSNSALAKNIY